MAAVLTVTGAALVVAHRRILTGNLDEALAAQAGAIAASAATGPLPATLVPGTDDDGIGQVVDAGGRVLAATPGDEGPAPIADPPAGATDRRTIDDVPGDPGVSYRVFSRRADGPGGPLVVHTAAPLDDIADSTALLARSLAVAVPAATALLAVVVWWLVGRTLRPVEAIRREVAGIGAGGAGLDRRVPVPAGDDEVARLARTMNAMLDRLEDASRRQQRFVADASHELRSPLARVRTEAGGRPRPPGSGPTRMPPPPACSPRSSPCSTWSTTCWRSPGPTPGSRPASAARSTSTTWSPARPAACGRGAGSAVDTRGVGAAQVVGDRDQLARAIGNVVDNAARHARSTVTLAVREDGGAAVVSVADDGPGIPPERRDEVFERFSRLDGARTAPTGGAGLGLAIAREIVVAHGGTIAVDPAHGPGARLVITLPLAPAPPVSPRPAEDRQPASPPTP